MSILLSLLVLGLTGLIASILLYVVARQFAVEEDPRIDLVQAVLPGANCGGCGFAGCRNFAEACVKQGNITGLSCPVGGEPVMDQVAAILVPTAEAEAPKEAAQAGAFTPQRAVALGAPDVLISDPKCAEVIKSLPTPRAIFPNLLGHLA
jgi:RnfABCDGE-type electron transport complex B subunit